MGPEGGSHEIACSAQTGASADRPGAGSRRGGRGAGHGPTYAQATANPAVSSAPQTRLAGLLRPDGTLDLATGLRGGVDARGYRLVSGPGEAPRFAPAPADAASAVLATETLGVPGDENWASGFSKPGTSSRVEALATDGDDHLYAGGWFTAAGGAAAYQIAMWDDATSSWSTLGSGLKEAVCCPGAIDDRGNLYAGGRFTIAGDAVASHIAGWDGTTLLWSALGTGMNGTVYALAVDRSGTAVYAGGSFTTAGGAPANRIAVWDTTTQSWSALGAGMDGIVFALAVDGDGNLYAGGLLYHCRRGAG